MYIIPRRVSLVKGENKKAAFFATFFENIVLLHVCKALDRLCEALDGLIRVTVFDAIPDTVLDMAL